MLELVQVEQVSVDRGPVDARLTVYSTAQLAPGLVTVEVEVGLHQADAQRIMEELGVTLISQESQFHTGMVAAVLAKVLLMLYMDWGVMVMVG